MKSFLYVANSQKRIAEPANNFGNWEMLRFAFQFGIRMADGSMADKIGLCRDQENFLGIAYANRWTVLHQAQLTSA